MGIHFNINASKVWQEVAINQTPTKPCHQKLLPQHMLHAHTGRALCRRNAVL